MIRTARPPLAFLALAVGVGLAACAAPPDAVVTPKSTPRASKGPGAASPGATPSAGPVAAASAATAAAAAASAAPFLVVSATPTAPGATPSPAPAASAAPNATPTPSPSPTPTPTPTPSPTATPAATPTAAFSAPASSGTTLVLAGTVHDEKGAVVDGARITVRSLDASAPYTASGSTSQGSWVVNNVPAGVNVEVVASKDGWTTRRRVGAFQRPGTGAVTLDFGAAGGTGDAPGAAHFLSDYPEIVSTEPAADATGTDGQALRFKLRLSEPLGEDARDGLADALRILPANATASGPTADASGPLDLATRADLDAADGTHDTHDGVAIDLAGGQAATLQRFGYQIEEGAAYLGSSTNRARTTWSADGTELTIAFAAPLLTASGDEGKYQAILISGGDPIEDAGGLQLGTDGDGGHRSYPAAGRVIANVFKEADLTLRASVERAAGGALSDRGAINWASTHDSVVSWEVRRDDDEPQLTAVDVSTNVNGDFRIELMFSEAMAAFDGTTRGASDQTGLRDLEGRYRFVLGDRVGDTDGVDLGGAGAPRVLQTDAAFAGQAAYRTSFGTADDLEDVFTFANASLAEPGEAVAAASPGEIVVAVDADNPNAVMLTIKGRPGFFASAASEIKAYVERVADPAGNAIGEAAAEDHQVRASI